MTDININDIDRLLQRFFDGFTTIEEEKALERFYASVMPTPAGSVFMEPVVLR